MNEFRSIPITVHQPRDIGAVLSNILSGSLGMAIMILPLIPEGVICDVPGPVFSKIRCEIQVIEDLATNRIGCTAIYIAEKIIHYLHLWRPQLTDWSEKLVLSSNNPWKSTQEGNNNIILAQM